MKAVYVLWGSLPHQPFRVLAFMALTARDDVSPPRYWGGHHTLATAALGRGLDGPVTESDYRAVRRALADLERAGAVVLEAPSSPGRNAEYRLRLLPTADADRPVNDANAGRSPSGEHRTLSAGMADVHRPEHRTLSDRTADAHRPPEEEQEPTGLISGTTPSVAAPRTGRANRWGRKRVKGAAS